MHNVGDSEAAERYCDQISDGKEEKVKQGLLLALFQSYLEAHPAENQASDYFAGLAKDLCNRRGTDFAPADLVAALPVEWSLASVAAALKKAIVKSKRDSRVTAMHAALAKADNVNVKHEKARLSKIKFELTENE